MIGLSGWGIGTRGEFDGRSMGFTEAASGWWQASRSRELDASRFVPDPVHGEVAGLTFR